MQKTGRGSPFLAARFPHNQHQWKVDPLCIKGIAGK
jgi:hypothetical protein